MSEAEFSPKVSEAANGNQRIFVQFETVIITKSDKTNCQCSQAMNVGCNK